MTEQPQRAPLSCCLHCEGRARRCVWDGKHDEACPWGCNQPQQPHGASAPCDNYREDLDRPCTGTVSFGPSDRLARCDECNAQHSRYLLGEGRTTHDAGSPT